MHSLVFRFILSSTGWVALINVASRLHLVICIQKFLLGRPSQVYRTCFSVFIISITINIPSPSHTGTGHPKCAELVLLCLLFPSQLTNLPLSVTQGLWSKFPPCATGILANLGFFFLYCNLSL